VRAARAVVGEHVVEDVDEGGVVIGGELGRSSTSRSHELPPERMTASPVLAVQGGLESGADSGRRLESRGSECGGPAREAGGLAGPAFGNVGSIDVP
jgi:hypothetical protein